MKNIFYGFLLLLVASCSSDTPKNIEAIAAVSPNQELAELAEKAQLFFKPLPTEAATENNILTEEKIRLGKKLYFDKRLSKDNTQSCNTCHNLKTFGVDNQAFSKGNDGELGGRNSPTTFNAALHLAQFWDGREPDVEAQAGGPILNPVEMAMPTKEAVVKRLSKIEEYIRLFAAAFPAEKEALTYQNLQNAIGAFERKLITPSRFDEYLKGDESALNLEEKEGLKLYIETGCTTCHAGQLLGGAMYQKFGLYGDYWAETQSKNIDMGRYDLTQKEADKYFFKVSSLRNIDKTAPYFHDGSVATLGEAVRIMAKLQLNKDLVKEEIDAIVLFLGTLTADIPQEWKEE